MVQAILTNRPGAGKITVALRDGIRAVSITKQLDIEDRVQPAYVRVYGWQGLPDTLNGLRPLTDTACVIARQLDEQILTIDDFDKQWIVYRAGTLGVLWHFGEAQPEGLE